MIVRLFSRSGLTSLWALILCLINIAATACCVQPEIFTYRAIEPCSTRNTLLAIDHTDNQDYCLGADKLVFKPFCRASFHLEVKPGKDRCRRVEQVSPSPPSTTHHQELECSDGI